MISQYFSSNSTPIALRPKFRAATRVAPLPANGSAITPFGARSMSTSISDTGLGVGCPIFVTSNDRFSFVAMTVLIGGLVSIQPLPSTYISSSCSMNAAFKGPGALPCFHQISRCRTSAGRGCRHVPKTIAGLSPHADKAESRIPVVLSPWMLSATFGLCVTPVRGSYDPRGAWLIPYGGSVTSTSASSHAVSSRQSP